MAYRASRIVASRRRDRHKRPYDFDRAGFPDPGSFFRVPRYHRVDVPPPRSLTSPTTVKVLLVDDDPAFRRLASMAMEEAGVEHQTVASASDALRVLERGEKPPFDLVLLDQELPGMKGWEMLAHLRGRGDDIPVVLVTVRDAVTDKVRALDLGADDYVVKPFEFSELVARLRAVIRRSRTSEPTRLGPLAIDPLLRHVTKEGRPIDLTPREFEILWVLVQAQDRTVSREEFLRRVWSMDFDPETNSIQVHVSRLRRKLGSLEGFRIETVRSRGYRLVSSAAPSRAESSQ